MTRPRAPAIRPRRSAFAAAFLSFLLPGLGHVYLRRWLRAVVWAILPVLAMTATVAVLAGPNRTDLLASLVDPDMLLAVLLVIALDLLYRLAAVLDAWQLARDRSVGSRATRALSGMGVLAVVMVLVVSHVAVAGPVLLAYDTVGSLDDDAGDTTPVPRLEDLGPGFEHLFGTTPTQLPEPGITPRPDRATARPDVADDGPLDSAKRLDILLIGADGGRAGSSTYLTDTMMVVSVDPRSGRLAFISLPRDTAGVPLPAEWAAARGVYGARFDAKINTLYTTARLQPELFPGSDGQRGYRALMGALSELYGLDIRYYVAVDLSGFRGAVNALGGLVVDVRRPLWDPAYPSDDGRGKLKMYVAPGIQVMNGQQALAYARSRKTTSDFDRAERQQQLVAGLRDQLDLASLLEPGVIDALVREFKTNVRTNIPPRLLPQLIRIAADVDVARRRSLVLSPEKGFSTECNACQPDGQYKLLGDVTRIRKAVQGVFSKGR
jgi:LCP family protein required for cell wall assembly